MRIQFTIDDALMNDASKAGVFATKKEVIEAGLRLLVQSRLPCRSAWSCSRTKTLSQQTSKAKQKLPVKQPA
jgi:Arc/MetJ family transcription regulator